MPYDGYVRRMELELRARYPLLSTKIYKVDDATFFISVLNELANFSQIEKDFGQKIRFANSPVRMAGPMCLLQGQKLASIADENMVSDFEGFPFTIDDLGNHIQCKHPGIDISEIRYDGPRRVHVILRGNRGEKVIGEVSRTVEGFRSPVEISIGDGGTEIMQFGKSFGPNFIPSAHSMKFLGAKYLERDEALWFDNVEKIYSGEVKKKDLGFVDETATSCIADFSGTANLNIRNHLLLYDVVYAVFPSKLKQPDFLNEQKIWGNDILKLVENGRLKIVLTSSENIYDYDLLNEAYKLRQDSVIGRRGLSALCATDLVELNQSYMFNDADVQAAVNESLTDMCGANVKKYNSAIQFMCWPKMALRQSLKPLHLSGPMGILNYGVNNHIIEMLDEEKKKDFTLPYDAFASDVHIAHALNATYFPHYYDRDIYLDYPFAVTMGYMLNLFKFLSWDALADNPENMTLCNQTNPSLEIIRIFEVSDYIPLIEFEQAVDSGTVRKTFRSLFSELSSMNDEELRTTIINYNSEIKKRAWGKKILSYGIDFAVDGLTSPVQIPFLGLLLRLGGDAAACALKKSQSLRNLSDVIRSKVFLRNEKKRKLSLLSRVSRVARLRPYYN